jgi:hypothetical protein
MKNKNLIITTIAILGLALISNAQVPNYVPSNGLVGWWPFNGNANDESGNGNDGIVNGATLIDDRFSVTNSAYYFNGLSNIQTQSINVNQQLTLSAWVKAQAPAAVNNSFNYSAAIIDHNIDNSNVSGYSMLYHNTLYYGLYAQSTWSGSQNSTIFSNENIQLNQWEHCVFTFDNGVGKIYKNNILLVTQLSMDSITQSNTNVHFGKCPWAADGGLFLGILDDIGIWNRALTQEEISNLFNATNCSNNLTISPLTNQLQTGNTANFIATTSDPNPNFVWQSDFGQGYVTLNNYGNYSGVNSNSLSISNVQLPNHTQQIRVISTSGECIDTSNVATINITDTCIVTINDTITTLISVTDTLVINTLITGLTPPNNSNTIKVFPNPANSHITIDFGNFESMNGYILKITNSIGQTVFTTPINQQSSYVDLSTWSGNGIYFVQIIDTLNNTIENRKIVLQ